MQRSSRLLAAIISIGSVGVKFIFTLFLVYFGSDKDFSLLIITYNTILISGMIFSLEHNKYYHRKAIQNNNNKNIELYERVYFEQTLVFKIFLLILTLVLLYKFSLIQRILIFLIVYIDIHLVETCRKNEVIGNYLKNVKIWAARISFPVIIFVFNSLLIKELFLNVLLISTLISFIIIKYLFDIRICNILNLKFKLILFLKLTIKTRQYAILTILGLLIPLIDKFVLLNYEEYSMIQTISLWAIFGNLISLFILEFINKPFKPKIMNFLREKDFNKIMGNIITYQTLLLIFFFIIFLFFKDPIEVILKPSYEFNNIQIFGCSIISAFIPMNTFFNTTLYGYKRDNDIMIFTIFEFILKYIITISTIDLLGSYYLPYTLAINILFTLAFKYLYLKKFIYSEDNNYIIG